MVQVDGSPDEGIAPGDFVTLSFKVPDINLNADSEVATRVISADDSRFVLAFEIADQSAVEALKAWAGSRLIPGARQPVSDVRTAHDLFADCLTAARRFFDDRFPRVLEQAREILFEQAHKASSHLQQTDAFDAMQEAERLMPAITSGFFDEFDIKMDQLWTGESGDDVKQNEQTPDELSLVDTGSFNDWLLTVQIITRAQRLVSDTERACCSRLGQILPAHLDANQMPFGLQGSCALFHDAIQNLGAVKITRHALLTAFEAEVVRSLPVLYGELGTILETAGVEPVKEKFEVRPAPESPRHAAGKSASEPESRDLVRSATHGAEAGDTPPPPAAEELPREAAVPATEPPLAGQAGPSASPPNGEARPIQGLGASPIWERDAYGTARQLTRLIRGPVRRPAAEPAGAELEVRKPAVDVESMLDLLVEAGKTGSSGSTGEVRVLELAQHVRDRLGAADLVLDDDTADLIEMVSDFIDVILLDPLVHPEVRERIRRLAFPLLRTALMGDPFFAAGPHPARQLLDALGIIQPGHNGDVMSKLDAAIAKILKELSPKRDLYLETTEILAPIAEKQREAFSRAIEEVASKCEAQQATLQSLRSKEAERADPDGTGEGGQLPALFQKTLERTDRISVGDVLLLDADHFAPRPATLGWRSTDGLTFTFITHSGMQAVSFTRRALAMELHRERIRKVEGSELALTERALCRRLYTLHQQVQLAATHDTLTGLVNRKHFIAEVETALERAGGSFDSDHLCLIQADRFEEIVARFGRKASKQLLKTFADMLKRQLGSAGIACRIKAHRFGVLLFAGDSEDALSYMQRFRRSVEEARCVLEGESFFVTVSSGVVTLDRESQNVDSAMSLAESALSAAAGAGGNRVEIAPNDETSTPAPEIVITGEPNVNDLIEQGRLFLRAQRIHPLELPVTHTYHEILLGVRAPDGETLGPGPIVAAAERRGQVGDLDRWVIRKALTWMMEAPERLEHVAGYSLNLSGATLGDEKLINDILELLSSTGVPPGKLIFEITETAGIGSFSIARNFLSSLQGQGCKFSLDDFGVGHASFAYLRNLPVDKVKIDGMFVKDLALNPNDRAVVQSITEIAHFMGRHTVAEFVENEEILGIVRKIGVDYAQGYGIEKARAIDELVMPLPPLASIETRH